VINPYTILPFRFIRFPNHRVLIVNEAGEHKFIHKEAFEKLINYQLESTSPIFLSLKGKHFLTDTDLTPVINLLATKYRTKKAFLRNFTTLHMVVVTLRCNQSCSYCHASSQPPKNTKWDMNYHTAVNTVHTIMETPAPSIKIEFQGGEPLLNFDVVKTIVKEAKKANKIKQKDLSFVICTNLTLVNKEVLNYLSKEDILVSTSLDGPEEIHNRHRKFRNGEGSYDKFIKKLYFSREILGHDKVSALMTTTKDRLSDIKKIIDEYVKQGFGSIFLRALNPYGYAQHDKNKSLKYPMNEFIDAYKEAISYLIEINLAGYHLEEIYTSILLSRILTPFSTGFVDLQSPTGAGISGAIYDYNGDVYPADEARMLAKMGDRKFYMGNVNKDSYLKIFGSKVLQELIKVSCVETIPGCHSCALQIYCGSDPIRNYALQGRLIGHQPTNNFCTKNKEIIRFLLEKIYENDPDEMDVFWSWIRRKSLAEIRGVKRDEGIDRNRG
jgi:uncharacterized protein